MITKQSFLFNTIKKRFSIKQSEELKSLKNKTSQLLAEKTGLKRCKRAVFIIIAIKT